jgi:nitrous oxide reductase accessory protein NosL
MKHPFFVLLLPILLLLSACGKEQTTGPVDVRWDREICARCAMAISSHGFAAEVRGGRKGKKPKVYKFDDIGCAVIWLDQQNWKDDPKTEIWVKDIKGDKWLDARKAWYSDIQNSPMDYGLAAQAEKSPKALNFEQAKKHIYEVEQRINPHIAKPREVESATTSAKSVPATQASQNAKNQNEKKQP